MSADASSGRRLSGFLRSLLDPATYAHVARLLHYYNYSHATPRARVRLGAGTGIAPNVSFRNGERIQIGAGSHIGERCFLWAGDESGRILIGDHVSLAPGVFVTASDYRFEAGTPFRQQPKRERDVLIGNDVWLGAYAVVTAGVSVGDGAIIGAGAVVTRDIPPGSVAVGVPARVIQQRPVRNPIAEVGQLATMP